MTGVPPLEPGASAFVQDLMIGLIWVAGSVVVGIGTYFWKSRDRAIAKLEETKVDREIYDNEKRHVEEKLDDLKERFEEVTHAMREQERVEKNIEISLSEMNQKVGNLAGRFEDATRLRIATDSETRSEIRHLRQALINYGRRKDDAPETLT